MLNRPDNNDQLEIISNLLSTQKKVHLYNINLKESFVDKVLYLDKVHDDFLHGLFQSDRIIKESYRSSFGNIIVESQIDFSIELEKFNYFIINEIKKKFSTISEQQLTLTPNTQTSPKTNQKVSQVGVTTGVKTGTAQQTYDLSDTIDYIEKYGISTIMENLRKLLTNSISQAIQFLASFTPIGAMAIEGIWGIMALYDSYQFFINSAPGSLANLIIDILCIISAGNLAKQLKPFMNSAGKSVEVVIENIMKSGAGKYIKPFLNVLQKGFSAIGAFLKNSLTFMKDKMGITWVSKMLAPVEKVFLETAQKLGESFASKAGSLVAKTSKNVANAIIRAGIKLGPRFEVKIFEELLKVPEKQLATMFATTVTQTEIKAVKKFAEKYLQEKPTETALEMLDKQFGTKMGDVYAIYLNGKKLAKHSSKGLSDFGADDISVDLMKGDITTDKTMKYSQKIGKSIENLSS